MVEILFTRPLKRRPCRGIVERAKPGQAFLLLRGVDRRARFA